MDFLFLNHSSSVEAVIVFLCLSIIFLFLLYDAILWMRQKYRELHPRKAYAQESTEENNEDKPLGVYQFLEGKHEIKAETPPQSEVANIEASVETEPSPGETLPIENVTGDAHIPDTDSSPLNTEASADAPTVPDTLPLVNIEGETQVREPSEEAPKEISIDEEHKIEESTTHSVENVTQEEPSPLVADSKEIQEEHSTKKEEKHASEPKKEPKKKGLSPEKKEKVIEIINNAKTLVARGHIDDARALIVNGLSLEKNNRDLNLLMSGIYERDHSFEKAEFVLKELAEHDSDDVEVLNHLATVVAMQRKFQVSYEIYKKILSLSGETEETLYTLSHIASELGLTDDVYNYSKSYLKQFPKNPEILWLYSQSQISKGERKGAIETLIKLKNLTPYNQEIVDLISKLVTEDELAGNFGEKPVL